MWGIQISYERLMGVVLFAVILMECEKVVCLLIWITNALPRHIDSYCVSQDK